MKITVYLKDRPSIQYPDCGYFLGMSADTEIQSKETKGIRRYYDNGILTITKGDGDARKNVAVFASGVWLYFEIA